MTVVYVNLSLIVAVDVGDAYEEGCDYVEVAELASEDADFGEWLSFPLEVVDVNDHDVVVDPDEIGLYAQSRPTWKIDASAIERNPQ